jgi:hypothetical protein
MKKMAAFSEIHPNINEYEWGDHYENCNWL